MLRETVKRELHDAYIDGLRDGLKIVCYELLGEGVERPPENVSPEVERWARLALLHSDKSAEQTKQEHTP